MGKFMLVEELDSLLNANYTDVDQRNTVECIDLLKQKIELLGKIIDSLPVAVYINDYKNIKHIWGNELAEKRMGASIQEINEKGIDWYLSHYCPEDIAHIKESINAYNENKITEFSRVYRIKPEGALQWQWSYSKSTVFSEDNEIPNKLILGIAIDLSSDLKTISQMEEMVKENAKLKNKLVLESLTKREKEVLQFISKGKKSKEIAQHLNISFHTVDTHRKNISRKLELHSMASLAAFAVENGL
ncbi:MAG: LuxR C-terminal-related transcriptional regulator [Bacteroidetes bacterium]|nr:LuxR C-terminal-related transcriptional regulator [Bacteroidota bacterium]